MVINNNIRLTFSKFLITSITRSVTTLGSRNGSSLPAAAPKFLTHVYLRFRFNCCLHTKLTVVYDSRIIVILILL